MNASSYFSVRHISDAEGATLSEACLDISGRVQLILRAAHDKDQAMASPDILKLHSVASQFSIRKVSEWPGTKLHYGAFAYAVTFCPSIEMLRAKPNLFASEYPSLEDPSFYRTDESLLLGSITHENEIWMNLYDDEWLSINAKLPGVFRIDDRKVFDS